MAEKLDRKREREVCFTAPEADLTGARFPRYRNLVVDGEGTLLGSPECRSALERLYPAAVSTRLPNKQELARDQVVPPLAGLCAGGLGASFENKDRKRPACYGLSPRLT